MQPIDIWLFEQEEIENALRQMTQRPDWYNQKAYPYDLYRYLTSHISPGNRDDIPFAPDTVFQFQPFGDNEFVHLFNSSMNTLVGRKFFADDLIGLLGNCASDLTPENYWGTKPMWPEELQRLYFPNGDLNPLIATRLNEFAYYDQNNQIEFSLSRRNEILFPDY